MAVAEKKEDDEYKKAMASGSRYSSSPEPVRRKKHEPTVQQMQQYPYSQGDASKKAAYDEKVGSKGKFSMGKVLTKEDYASSVEAKIRRTMEEAQDQGAEPQAGYQHPGVLPTTMADFRKEVSQLTAARAAVPSSEDTNDNPQLLAVPEGAGGSSLAKASTLGAGMTLDACLDALVQDAEDSEADEEETLVPKDAQILKHVADHIRAVLPKTASGYSLVDAVLEGVKDKKQPWVPRWRTVKIALLQHMEKHGMGSLPSWIHAYPRLRQTAATLHHAEQGPEAIKTNKEWQEYLLTKEAQVGNYFGLLEGSTTGGGSLAEPASGEQPAPMEVDSEEDTIAGSKEDRASAFVKTED